MTQKKYQNILNQLNFPSKQVNTNNQFKEARNLIGKNNRLINIKAISDYSLLVFAAQFNNIDTIKYLLEKQHLNEQIKDIKNLGNAITFAATNNHYEALGLLIDNKVILNKVTNANDIVVINAIKIAALYNHYEALGLLISNKVILNKTIENVYYYDDLICAIKYTAEKGHHKSLDLLIQNDKIVNAIIKHYNAKTLTEALTKIPALHVQTIDTIARRREKIVTERIWSTIIAATIPAAATTAISGGFAVMLLASKNNKVKNCDLMVNHLTPLFYKLNKQFIKISTKLNLNNLTKALTDPKVAGLIIAMTVIIGAIISASLGFKKYRKQGGAILGK